MQQLLNHDELRESFRELLSAESDSHAVRKMLDGDTDLRSQLWAKVAELGWLGLAIDEKYGGLGLSLAEVAIGYEEFGRHLTPVPFMMTTLAAHAVTLAGTEEQKAQWLPRLASGEISASLALAHSLNSADFFRRPEDPPNPGPGGGDQVFISFGERGSARLNGRLQHFVDANVVDVLLVPVSGGLAILEQTAAGVTVTPRSTIDQTRSLCDVSVEGVEVAPEHILRLSPAHWAQLLDHASVALACDSIGGATHILEKTVEYLKTRVQFNRPIGSFQALKHRCATWKILLEAASALTSNAAQMLAADAPQRASSASGAKFYACDAYAAIAGDAVQLHGGIGFTWEHDCHLFLKRAKLNQVLFGSTVEHQERVARIVLPSSVSDARA